MSAFKFDIQDSFDVSEMGELLSTCPSHFAQAVVEGYLTMTPNASHVMQVVLETNPASIKLSSYSMRKAEYLCNAADYFEALASFLREQAERAHDAKL